MGEGHVTPQKERERDGDQGHELLPLPQRGQERECEECDRLRAHGDGCHAAKEAAEERALGPTAALHDETDEEDKKRRGGTRGGKWRDGLNSG